MNILLCCSAGMSTSLLVTKMEAAAKARGLEGKIWAVSGDAVKTNIDQADVLLLLTTSSLHAFFNENAC